ncbi:hypothetical protein SELMODRAFT_72000, partial [Selaginella moellendorffii]
SVMVTAYAQAGKMEHARDLFNRCPTKSLLLWNLMIQAYAQDGHCRQALEIFHVMNLESCPTPDEATLQIVLAACSYEGYVDGGRDCFISMQQDHGLVPEVEHFCCIADCLGRAGLLVQAEMLIRSMPCLPNSAAWTSLLGSCNLHGDVQLGASIMDNFLELEEMAAPYILLSNIYA